MGRVIEPLSQMGAQFQDTPGGRLPLMVRGNQPSGADPLNPARRLAQVKSAILLAGLNTPGETTVIEPIATRDHSERMLADLVPS